ncbi:hypothetical protein OESDEN_00083, partial [Oesophagostomum dentatum]
LFSAADRYCKVYYLTLPVKLKKHIDEAVFGEFVVPAFSSSFLQLARRSYLAQRLAGSTSIAISPATYPSPRRDDSIVDDFHGTKVPDPYRWMEDPDAPETRKFVDELNAISEPFIEAAPSRERIRERVIYQQKSLNEKGEVFLDPNTMSEDGTTFLRISAWTKDGSIFAYGLSEKGSDWVTVKVGVYTEFTISSVVHRISQRIVSLQTS